MKNKIKIWNKVDFRGFQSPEVREKKSKSQEFIYVVFIVMTIKTLIFISSLYPDLAKSS
jgi:hypothetical protein